jgi:Skp family chaperone for outer membrane proteins
MSPSPRWLTSDQLNSSQLNSTYAQISLLLVLGFSIPSLAQLNVAKEAQTTGPVDTTFRIATINMQQTILASSEGRRDFEALNLKFEPKEAELKRLSEEIDGLKKQLDTQQSMLSDEARGKLVTSIESKKKKSGSGYAGCSRRFREPATRSS